MCCPARWIVKSVAATSHKQRYPVTQPSDRRSKDGNTIFIPHPLCGVIDDVWPLTVPSSQGPARRLLIFVGKALQRVAAKPSKRTTRGKTLRVDVDLIAAGFVGLIGPTNSRRAKLTRLFVEPGVNQGAGFPFAFERKHCDVYARLGRLVVAKSSLPSGGKELAVIQSGPLNSSSSCPLPSDAFKPRPSDQWFYFSLSSRLLKNSL